MQNSIRCFANITLQFNIKKRERERDVDLLWKKLNTFVSVSK